MEIANLHLVEKFKRIHAAAGKPMKEWADKDADATWKNPTDVKRMFASASFVRGFVIFNIGGNKYRLLTEIFYQLQRVRILKVGTHEQYDRWEL